MTNLRIKCTKFDFGWGSAPDPTGGAYSALPIPLAGFESHFMAEGGAGLGRGGRGKWRVGKGRAPKFEPGPLRALLRH